MLNKFFSHKRKRGDDEEDTNRESLCLSSAAWPGFVPGSELGFALDLGNRVGAETALTTPINELFDALFFFIAAGDGGSDDDDDGDDIDSSSPSTSGVKDDDDDDFIYLSFSGNSGNGSYEEYVEQTRAKLLENQHRNVVGIGADVDEWAVDHRRVIIRGSKLAVVFMSKAYMCSTKCLSELELILECFQERRGLFLLYFEVVPIRFWYQTGDLEIVFQNYRNDFPKHQVDAWTTAIRQALDFGSIFHALATAIAFGGKLASEIEVHDDQPPRSTPSTTEVVPMERRYYDVFLSFRGTDTRNSFTDHLYRALREAGFHVFRDDDELERGESIESELKRAIEQSKVMVIVFSKTYATSRWCLDELVQILRQKNEFGQHVLPIFYNVTPSEVRHQSGDFEQAFSQHQTHHESEKVGEWRAALKEVAGLAGMELQNRSEAGFIDDIVQQVSSKMRIDVPGEMFNLIGVHEELTEITMWLDEDSDKVDLMAICGMSGVGKTTIAKAIYYANRHKFPSSCILENIGEIYDSSKDLVSLQEKLLLQVQKRSTKQMIYSVDEGTEQIKRVLCCKKVLLVLDGVDQEKQLEALIGGYLRFYPGSKIILTMTDQSLVRCYNNSCRVVKVEPLGDKDSLVLFSRNAFKEGWPTTQDFMDLSNRVVNWCSGIPLALKLLGASLRGRNKDYWESAIEKFEVLPNNQMVQKLKMSYDCLPDRYVKALFLDIACFFSGMDKDYVAPILEGCKRFPGDGFGILMDRCLLTIDHENKLIMHKLIKDMGRAIVEDETKDLDPGERSRIWKHEDACHVLKNKTGSRNVQGLVFDSRMLNEEGTSTQCEIHTDAFVHMVNLSLLQLNYVSLVGSYDVISKELRWLCWHGCPLQSLPKDLDLEKLVILDLQNSNLQNVWKGAKCVSSLKILDLSYSQRLIKTPDLSAASKLESLILMYCVNLVEVDASIGKLRNLTSLNLKGCKNLRKLPQELHQVNSLKTLILTECSNIFNPQPSFLGMLDDKCRSVVVPQEPNTMNKFTAMGLQGVISAVTTVFQIPLLRWSDTGLRWPCLPQFLTNLDLENCHISDDVFLDDLNSLTSLAKLKLNYNPICILPESIKNLEKLTNLSLRGCEKLESLPKLPNSMLFLDIYNCRSLKVVMAELPHFLASPSVIRGGCPELVEVKGMYKLEPIQNIDANLLTMFGIKVENLQLFEGLRIKLYNWMTLGTSYFSPQGLHECGILSIFLPGSEIPQWFGENKKAAVRVYSTDENPRSSLTVTVPSQPSLQLQGLNVGVVYSSKPGFVSRTIRSCYLFKIIIRNKTKSLNWTYWPVIMAVPSHSSPQVIWLSHWRFAENELQEGDDVEVSVANSFDEPLRIEIQLLYDAVQSAENEKDSSPSYLFRPDWYYLCNHDWCSRCFEPDDENLLNLLNGTPSSDRLFLALENYRAVLSLRSTNDLFSPGIDGEFFTYAFGAIQTCFTVSPSIYSNPLGKEGDPEFKKNARGLLSSVIDLLQLSLPVPELQNQLHLCNAMIKFFNLLSDPTLLESDT